MSTEENAAVARRWFTEGWTGNTDLADEIFAADFTTNGQRVGPAGQSAMLPTGWQDSPTCSRPSRIRLLSRIVLSSECCGAGPTPARYSGIEPTGIHVEQRGIIMWRFAAGRVVEDWTVADQFGLLQQVGLVPPGVIGAQVPATNNTSIA